jgi:hypothetical protein
MRYICQLCCGSRIDNKNIIYNKSGTKYFALCFDCKFLYDNFYKNNDGCCRNFDDIIDFMNDMHSNINHHDNFGVSEILYKIRKGDDSFIDDIETEYENDNINNISLCHIFAFSIAYTHVYTSPKYILFAMECFCVLYEYEKYTYVQFLVKKFEEKFSNWVTQNLRKNVRYTLIPVYIIMYMIGDFDLKIEILDILLHFDCKGWAILDDEYIYNILIESISYYYDQKLYTYNDIDDILYYNLYDRCEISCYGKFEFFLRQIIERNCNKTLYHDTYNIIELKYIVLAQKCGNIHDFNFKTKRDKIDKIEKDIINIVSNREKNIPKYKHTYMLSHPPHTVYFNEMSLQGKQIMKDIMYHKIKVITMCIKKKMCNVLYSIIITMYTEFEYHDVEQMPLEYITLIPLMNI